MTDTLVQLQQTLYHSKNPTRRYLHNARKDWIEEAIDKHTVTHGTALEIGPGSGIYLPRLSKGFKQALAVDIESAYIEHARPLSEQYPNLDFMIDDITDSALLDNSIDLILCTEVIEHIEDSQKVLHEIHRILKPGGTLILSTPQKFSPLELTAKIAFLPGIINIVRMIYREPILETGHINLMTHKTMMTQLKNAHFKIESTEKTGLYLPLVAEFMGKTGLSIERFIEKKIHSNGLNNILWTQYFIAKKPA